MDNLEPITRNEMFLNGDDLEPITREEMILAGADLEPITRHEWFLKRYRGGGGGGGYDLVNIPDLPADIASFSDGTDLPMASLKVAVTPYQDLSHGDPSPENICPISGWDEVDVNKSGVNVWDEEWELGYYFSNSSSKITKGSSATTIRSKNPIRIKPNKSYHIVGGIYRYFFVDNNGNVLSYGNGVDFTTPSNARFLYFYCENTTTYNNDISINYPSTDTSYHAYNGQTYTIDLDGTRYGGVVDVTSGVLTVDRVGVDLGTLDWNNDSQGLFVTQLPNDSQTYGYNSDLSNLMSDMWAPKVRDAGWAAMTDGQYGIATRQLRIKYSSVETTEAFATLVNGSIFVYELATPITVQLSPTQVKSLEGENKIFANCGQITEGKYFKRA